MTSSPHYGNGQPPKAGRKGPISAPHQSPKTGHPYLPYIRQAGRETDSLPTERIEITQSDGLFDVAVIAGTGRGDEIARVSMPKPKTYDDAIMSADRYARATGLLVVDLVVT